MDTSDLVHSYQAAERAKAAKAANLVIWHSQDGKTDWKPVMAKDVPDWVRAESPVGLMVSGDMIHHPTEQSGWYRAEVIGESSIRLPQTPKIIEAAEIVSVDDSKPDGVTQVDGARYGH